MVEPKEGDVKDTVERLEKVPDWVQELAGRLGVVAL